MVLGRVALAFVAPAMAKQRQEMVQRVDALTDTLTGTPQRRALDEFIDVLQNKAFLASKLSVLFFDLDHFKDVNDTFGHETVTAHRKSLPRRPRNIRGPRQKACTGGEEFAAVPPGRPGRRSG